MTERYSTKRRKSVSVPALSEQEYRWIKSRNKPFYDLRRTRARARWRRVQTQLYTASMAFSTAGKERRKAFVERPWFTVGESDPYQTRRRSAFAMGLSPSEMGESEHLLNNSRQSTMSNLPGDSLSVSSRNKDRSVSFEDEQHTLMASRVCPQRRRLVPHPLTNHSQSG